MENGNMYYEEGSLKMSEPVKSSSESHAESMDGSEADLVSSINDGFNLLERSTPNTELYDFSADMLDDMIIRPDISVVCKQCQVHIGLNELSDHKRFHEALNSLGLSYLPESEEDLMEKRKMILRNLQSKYLKKPKDFNTIKACEWNTRVKQINLAYELLKSYINNTFELNRQLVNTNVRLDSHGEARISLNGSIVAIGSCLNQNKLFRKYMEDSNIILDKFGENENLTYIGTFDGYDGDVASSKCSFHLHLSVLNTLAKLGEEVEYFGEDEINDMDKYATENIEEISVPSAKETTAADELSLEERAHLRNYKYALENAFRQMDKLLSRGRDEKSKIRWSGATGCVCVVEQAPTQSDAKCKGWIHIANSGDVEAIAVMDNSASKNKPAKRFKLLTRLHTYSACVRDRERVEKSGGRLVETSPGNQKIEGLYNVSRGLGFHGDKNVKKFLSASPTMRSYKLEANFICVVIATKGLWSVLSYERVAELILQTLPTKKLLIASDRAISPSVKNIVHQYKHEKLKENSKLQSNLPATIENGEEEYEAENEADEQSQISLGERNAEKLQDNSDYGYYYANRPKSVPYNRLFSSNDENKQASKQVDSAKSNFREKSECNFKSNSDIYPAQNRHSIMNQNHDLSLEMSELEVERSNLKPLGSSNQALSSDLLKSFYKNAASQSKRDYIEIIPTDYKSVQVTSYELNKVSRKFMDDRKTAKRLEISEYLVERIVTSALVAGSKENITVNCVLLNGSNL